MTDDLLYEHAGEGGYCGVCDEPGPCRVDLLIAERDRLREENAAMRGNLKGNPVLATFDGIARLRRIEEAAKRADEWAMTAGAGTGWGPMATIHDILRAALTDGQEPSG